jgi:hypothetical protein
LTKKNEATELDVNLARQSQSRGHVVDVERKRRSVLGPELPDGSLQRRGGAGDERNFDPARDELAHDGQTDT